MVKIIAEIGVNHDGNPKKAHEYIDCAKQCGADAVKFQLFNAETLEPEGERRDMLKGLQLDRHTHRELMNHARGVGLEYICTPFDVKALNWLVLAEVKTIKIGSGNNTDKELLHAAAISGCGIIMSTGMMTTESLTDSMRILGHATLLHCISAYPAPIEDMNLRVIPMLRNSWRNCDVGLSDHSIGTILPAAAVAMGATVIEKHLTFDPEGDGPDHKASITPLEFSEMVENIRTVESALGDGTMNRPECEREVMGIAKERQEYAKEPSDIRPQKRGAVDGGETRP